MVDKTRNQLLIILSLSKKSDDLSRKIEIDNLLEQFEYDLKDRLADLIREQTKINDNLELLKYVKENIKEKNNE